MSSMCVPSRSLPTHCLLFKILHFYKVKVDRVELYIFAFELLFFTSCHGNQTLP